MDQDTSLRFNRLQAQIELLTAHPRNRQEEQRREVLQSMRTVGDVLHAGMAYRFQQDLACYGEIGAATITSCGDACPCGRHVGLQVQLGDTVTVANACPVTLWMFRIRQFMQANQWHTMRQWAQENPIRRIAKPYVETVPPQPGPAAAPAPQP